MERTIVNRRYRVDRRIGEGGMAEVYLGHDLLLNRAIAVKAMRPQYAGDPTFRARFQREAAAVAGLTHPNIVEIFDVGEANGRPYLVMEYVPGDTLRQVIDAEGPFAPDDVAALLEQVGSALDFAHEHGIIHRDIKPQNILVAPDGVVKVVDFGIAHDLHGAPLTEFGASMGTVQYTSPEQASGLPATPASDVYALGVVAYEMLTGRPPLVADNPVALAMRHVHEQPRAPSSVFPHVPWQVDHIVLRALHKDPTRRFPSAGMFAAAMTDWQRYSVLPSSPGPSGTSWHANPPPGWADSVTGSPAPDRATWPIPPTHVPHAPASPHGLSKRCRVPLSPPSLSRRDEVGWTTWLVGSLSLVAIVALVWAGVRLAPGLSDLGEGGPAQAGLSDQRSADNVEGAEQGDDATDLRTVQAREPSQATTEGRAVPVPDVTGKSLSEATELLTARGLLVEDREPVFSESVPANAIAEQDPPPNALVSQGTTVVIKLSRGSATVDLTAMDLIGKKAAEVERRLVNAGLEVEVVQVGHEEIPKGHVVKIEPGSRASIGETVLISVSAGDAIQVPAEIQGRPVDDVERQLERAGLDVVAIEPVGRSTIEAAGVDLDEAGIDPDDVVGFQAAQEEADFGVWLPRDTEITLYYYAPEVD